ncbi:MAG: hypothetical protein GWN14_11220, partial [candidate division Zixibacteria bacterium]|nr:hypothetical protein [Gammaproteobacteria bacterium]NIX56462.1 hypothetical protein [candidate division Zixibacteria bacterium]
GAPVIAHELCHAFLAEMRQKAWDAELLRAHERNPNLKIDYTAVDWDEFRLIMPDIVFSQEKVIDLDGVTLQLSHVGGDHAADSIVVKVVESGVMFLGDCYYPRNHTSDPISTSMLDSLVDDAYELYIDGHREPFSRARIERIVRLYKYLPRSR